MNYLVDTQLLIWSEVSPGLMPARARAIFDDAEQDLAFSVVSLWEAVIKTARGRLDFNVDARVMRAHLLDNGLSEIVVSAEHVLAVAGLAQTHGDPFDRLLLAQAKTEGLRLLTTDKQLARYGDPVERV